jgi:predicted membrane protein
VAIGAGRWSDAPTSTNRLWSAALIVFGLLFFCVSMGWLHLRAHGASWPFAILLTTFGFLILNPRRHQSSTAAAPGEDPSRFGPDLMMDTAVFGGVKRRVETLNLRGGNLLAVMGSVELDLRRAQLADASQPVIVEAICVFGAIKLRIPETWRVSIAGTHVFGAYEDKTAPLVRPDLINGTVVITGATIFGAVEIEN